MQVEILATKKKSFALEMLTNSLVAMQTQPILVAMNTF